MSVSAEERDSYGRGFTAGGRDQGGAGDLAAGVGAVATAWEPHAYQAPLLTIDAGVILAIGALGSGKSEPGALKLIQWALRHPRRADGRPTKWYVIGPDFSLIRQEQMGKLLEHCRRIQLPGVGRVVRRVTYGIDPRIVLMHGQVILGRSATDPDRLRGHEIDGFWGDEVQEWDEKAFRIAFSRLRSASAIRVVLTGSPEDTPGWLWHMLSGKHPGYNALRDQLAKNGTGFYAFRWRSSQNTANQEGVLGALRTVMDATAGTTSAQELEGRFPGTHEAPLLMGEIDYAPAMVDRLELSPTQAVGYSLGVDVGETRDFSWLTVLSRDGVVLAQDRFNVSTPGVPRQGFYPFLERRVEQVARRFGVKVVVVDTSRAGAGVAQHLAIALGSFATVVGVDTGAGNKKSDLLEVMGTAMSRGDLRVPERWGGGKETTEVQWVDYLKKELSELQPTEYGKGRRRWDHPAGGHDDGPVALALAYHGLSSARVAGMFRREWLRYARLEGGKLLAGGSALEPKALVRFATFALNEGDAQQDAPVVAVFGADPRLRRLVLLDVIREQLAAPEIAPRIRKAAADWKVPTTFVGKHDVGTMGLVVADAVILSRAARAVRGAGVNIGEVEVASERSARALPVTSALSGGSVFLLAGASWLPGFESELLEFPGGPHGNQVDALSVGVAVFNELVMAAAERPQPPGQIMVRGR